MSATFPPRRAAFFWRSWKSLSATVPSTLQPITRFASLTTRTRAASASVMAPDDEQPPARTRVASHADIVSLPFIVFLPTARVSWTRAAQAHDPLAAREVKTARRRPRGARTARWPLPAGGGALPTPVGALGLGRQERHVAVHRHPLTVPPRQVEGGPAVAREWPPVRGDRARRPRGRDPRRVPRAPDVGVRVEAELADARPDLPPLLALDVVQAVHRGGVGAEGDRVRREEPASRGEVAAAARGLEAGEPVEHVGSQTGHARIMEPGRALSSHSRRPPCSTNRAAAVCWPPWRRSASRRSCPSRTRSISTPSPPA